MDDNLVNAVSASAAYVHDALQRFEICVDVDSGAPERSVKTWMALAEFVGEWRLCPALRPSRVSRAERGTRQFHPFHEELAPSER